MTALNNWTTGNNKSNKNNQETTTMLRSKTVLHASRRSSCGQQCVCALSLVRWLWAAVGCHLNDFMCPCRKTWKTCLCLCPELESTGSVWTRAITTRTRTRETARWGAKNKRNDGDWDNKWVQLFSRTNSVQSSSVQSSFHRNRPKQNKTQAKEKELKNPNQNKQCPLTSGSKLQVWPTTTTRRRRRRLLLLPLTTTLYLSQILTASPERATNVHIRQLSVRLDAQLGQLTCN